MTGTDLLVDAFDRVRESVHRAVEGLSGDQLAYRADPQANSIAWLVWHLTRVQDDHVSELADSDQEWLTGGWAKRFGLALEETATGFGQTSEEVAAVRVEDPALLTGYHDAVHERTVAYLRTLREDDFGRVIDERWDPPVTLGVRLVSVVNDDTQHVGQAAFVRGMAERSSAG